MPNDLEDYLDPLSPRDRVHSIASKVGVSSDLADDYLSLTKVESSHNINVRNSSKGAQGFGQVMPDVKGGTTRTVGGTRYNLKNPDENIEAGIRYFAEGGSDPVARRLHYFGGPGARKRYERTGKIPNISDGNMTASQYVKATGGQRQSGIESYLDPVDTPPAKTASVEDYLDPGPQQIQPTVPHTRFGAPKAPIKQYRPEPFAGVTAGASGHVQPSATGLGEAPGSPLTNVFKKPQGELPVNPSKIVVRPRPATLKGQNDDQVRADIRRQVAEEQSRYTVPGRAPRLVGREVDAEVEAQFQAYKQDQASGIEYARTGNAMSGRNSRLERFQATLSPYTPGLASLDTPMGIKTDLPRGVLSGLTLGAVGSKREITPEEKLADPNAGKGIFHIPLPGGGEVSFSEHEIGEMAGSLVPLIGGGKVLAKVGAKLSPAKRTSILFGGLETGRQAVNAVSGREVDLSAPLMSAALGLVMGKLGGHDAGLIRRIVAYVSPGLALDVAKGTPPEEAAKTALTNFGFAIGMGGKPKGERNARQAETRGEVGAAMPGRAEVSEPQQLRADQEHQPQRFQHLQFGEVEVTELQQGANRGKLRVAEVSDPSKIHYVQKAALTGRGNERMIPLKPTETAAIEPADTLIPVEGALPATPPASKSLVNEAETVSPSVREGEKDFTHFKAQGLSNLEAATRAAHEKVFQGSRDYYRERLANPELLDRAIPLTSSEGNLFAVPVGGSRKTGASEVLYSKPEGERLLQEIKGRNPGFENARLRPVGNKFSLEWGGPEAGYRSETNPTEAIGRAYGYSEKAIADFIQRKRPQPSPQVEAVKPTPKGETIEATVEGSSTAAKRGERQLPKSLEKAGLPGGTERFYDVKSNIESESKARQAIKDRGVDEATSWVQSGEKPSLEQTATALELIKGLAREAETETNPETKAAKLAHIGELSSTMSVRSTEAGQSIQYLYTLARESPEGALYYAERSARRKNPDVGLSRDARSQVFDIATRLKATETELESVKKLLEAAQKTRGVRKPSEVTTKIREWADQAERDARARLAARSSPTTLRDVTSAVPDIADYSIIGAAKLAKGTVNFAEWSKQMVGEFGDEVRPYLRQIRSQSQRLLDDQGRIARSGKVLDEITRLGTESRAESRVIDAANEIAKGASRTEIHRKVKAEGLSAEEANQIVGRAQKLVSEARKGLREGGKERAAQKREPDASPERLRELTAERDKLLAARGKGRRELIAFQKRLEQGGPSIGSRLNNAYRGIVVSAVQTASRNLGTQTVRTGVESLTDAFELAIVRAKVKGGGKLKEGDIDPKTRMLDTLKSTAYLFQRNRRMVNGILDEFPVEHEQMFRRFSSDVELAPPNKLAKGADKAMGYVEKGIEMVNVFNRAQEFIGRRATFRGVLEARLKARGIDLNSTVKEGKQGEIPREDIQAAVDSALRVTFAESPKAGTKSDMFVRFTSSLPAPVNPLTFSRFLWNGAKFTAEYQPTTALRGLYRTATGKPGAARDYAKAAVGTAMLLTADQIYQQMHRDESEWYLLENPATGNEFDIRPYQPFASYIFAAHFLRSKMKGEQVSYEPSRMGKAGVYVEGLTGFQARPNPAWEGAKSVATEDWPGVVNQIKRIGGETVAATLTPLKTPKQIFAAFDENEGVMRNTRNRPFKDPIINAIPKLSQSLEPVIRKEQEVRQPSPLLQPLGIREIDPNTKYTRAENLTRSIRQSKYGEDDRTDAEIGRSKNLSDLRGRSRKGEDVSDELEQLHATTRQENSILDAVDKTKLQEDVNSFTPEESLNVYQVATPKERDEIRPTLEKKLATRKLAELTLERQADIRARMKTLGVHERLPGEIVPQPLKKIQRVKKTPDYSIRPTL